MLGIQFKTSIKMENLGSELIIWLSIHFISRFPTGDYVSLGNGSPVVVPGPAASESPRNLLGIQNLGLLRLCGT